MARFLRKPQAAQNTISVVKRAELSLASWGRGWALPCPTFKYHTPRGLVGSPGLAQAEVARTGQKDLLCILPISAGPGLVPYSLKDATMLQVSPSTVCPGCPWFLFVPMG